MTQKAILIACYAAFLLAGGLIGYLVAGSLISIIVSTLFAALLSGSSFFIWKGNKRALDIATYLVGALFLFFIYRFSTTLKIVPAGMMTLISLALLSNLVIFKRSEKVVQNAP